VVDTTKPLSRLLLLAVPERLQALAELLEWADVEIAKALEEGRPKPRGWAALSKRERQVADLIVKGMSRKQVAGALYLSQATVDMYLVGVYKKLRLHSAVELVNFYHRAMAGSGRPGP
jgi:DNA-binding NarL/FixJ family response regulator